MNVFIGFNTSQNGGDSSGNKKILNLRMQNEYFSITKDTNQENVSHGSLSTSLNNWKLIADEFVRASEVLYSELTKDNQKVINDHSEFKRTGNFVNRGYTPHLNHVYFLQIGYCLENMIKGILTYHNPQLVDGKEIAKRLKSHKLVTFTPDLRNIQFGEDDKQLLEFVTEIIIWFGKYPIPTKAQEAVRSAAYRVDKVRDAFFSLYDKLSQEMESTGNLKQHLHCYSRQYKNRQA